MKRKGISPVIGEFILVVVVILLGIPMIGISFGSMSGFTHPAEVLVSSSSCEQGEGNGTACGFILTNVGAGTTQTIPTAIYYLHHGDLIRATVSNSCNGGAAAPLNGSSSYDLNCNFNIAPGSPGDIYSGSVILSNGANVPFEGRFG